MTTESESTQETLAEAPIIEAVFDIKVELPPDLDLSTLLAEARKAFADDYPKASKFFAHSVELTTGEEKEGEIEREKTVRGVRLRHVSENQLLHIHQEGFSFNRLAPYSSFDDYLPEVRRCWDRFVEIAKPVCAYRVTLRNINRVRLPKDERGDIPLQDYIHRPPELPPNVGGIGMTDFMQQIRIVEMKTELHGTVTLASEPQVDGRDWTTMILDIETYDAGACDPKGEMIWEIVKNLRTLKNRIFRATLTEKCLQPYL